MKTISLRTFRVAVDRLTEPVIVVKREGGELRTLGTWTPQGAKIPYRDTWADPAPKPKR